MEKEQQIELKVVSILHQTTTLGANVLYLQGFERIFQWEKRLV